MIHNEQEIDNNQNQQPCCNDSNCCNTPEPYTRSYPKVGRNSPCPCGSGYKFKKCCGK